MLHACLADAGAQFASGAVWEPKGLQTLDQLTAILTKLSICLDKTYTLDLVSSIRRRRKLRCAQIEGCCSGHCLQRPYPYHVAVVSPAPP